MKQTAFLTVVFLTVTSASIFAALGNTENEVADLFGKPTDVGLPDNKGVSTNLYQKGDYVILVQFLRHLSLAESYTRKDQHELSPREIDAFLEGSSNERAWIKDPNKLEWERDDHKAKAWCQTIGGRPTLLIQAK